MILPEPDISKNRKEPEKESFMNYEDILPQDRTTQAGQNQDRVVVTPGPKPRTSQDIVKEIFSYTPPKPNYDPNRPDELKRLAQSSAIGKGLNLVGDFVGLGTEANVRRRQPDNKELGYLDNLYRYIDDYNRRMDDWNWKDYMTRLRGKEMELNLTEKEKDRELRDKSFQADQMWKQLGFQSDQAYKKYQMQKGDRDFELAEKRLGQQADIAKQNAAIAYSRMDWDKVKHYNDLALKTADQMLKSEGKGYNLYSADGNQNIKINDQGELQKLYTLITNDESLKTDVAGRVKLLEPSFGSPGSANEQKIIVSEFWEKSKDVQDWLKNQGKLPDAQQKQQSNWQMPQNWQRPQYQGPVRQGAQPSIQTPGTPQPQQQTKTPQEPGVMQDSAAIQDKYSQLGVDITQDSSYNVAMQVAIKQGIINPNSNLSSEQLQQVKEIAQQIEQDKETLRVSQVMRGVGYQTPQDSTQTEVPLFFQ
jgi:hypothetical protein